MIRAGLIAHDGPESQHVRDNIPSHTSMACYYCEELEQILLGVKSHESPHGDFRQNVNLL